ncbi:hypothetical protein, partial [Salipiger bermudensis]|uniref:hypothetical protein n=1 Tax=Salipiger bermudensis TaxID=344736 RepID=UPI001CD2AE58
MQPAKVELRRWAVDTINYAAEVKFDEEASDLLINGTLNLNWSWFNSQESDILSGKLDELVERLREDAAETKVEPPEGGQ